MLSFESVFFFLPEYWCNWRKWGVEKKQVVEDHTEYQPQVVGWALEKVGA